MASTSSTASNLVPLLKSQDDARACLRFAAAQWIEAGQLDDTERRQSTLAEATATVLKNHFGQKDQDEEEDLFSDGAKEDEEALSDCVSALLQLCGFVTVPLSGNSGGAASTSRFGLRLAHAGEKASGGEAPVEFLQAVLEFCPELAHAAATAALEPFRSYRLDKLENDVADDIVMRELRSCRSVLVLFGVALCHEAQRSHEASLSSAGDFERSSALSPLLSSTTIVASTELFAFVARPRHATRTGPSHALNYFSCLPSFPRPQPQPTIAHIGMLRLRLHVLQDLATGVLEKTLRSPKYREGALAFISRAIALITNSLVDCGQSKIRGEMHDEWSDTATASSGFVINVSMLLLRLFDPLCKNPGKIVPSVDWKYVLNDERLHFSVEDPILTGGDNEDNHGVDGDETSAGGMRGAFKFTTEIFFLASAAMHLVKKMQSRKEDHGATARRIMQQLERAHGGGGTGGSSKPAHPVIERMHGCLVTLELGWKTQLLDTQFMAMYARWAQFTANWLSFQAEQPGARRCFQRLPAKMIKAVAAAWLQCARHFSRGSMDDLSVFTPQMAQEAVLFCTTFMCNDLVSSPVLQDCLLSVMNVIINSGSSDTTARDNVYFGARRGLAGIVMDSSAIRTTTAPAVMELYISCQHAEGLNSDDDSAFNKHSIRHKISRILEKLYRHPLPESKSSILTFFAGDKFDSFLVAAIDTVVYILELGIKALHEGLILEKNRGASYTTPEYEKLKLQSESRTGFLQANITFDMLAMLFENEIVRERFATSRNSTQTRVVASLWTFIEWNCIDCELLIGSTIADSDVWRGDENTAVSFNRPCSLLSICLSSNEKLLKMLLSVPTFDLRVFEAATGCKGGECLQPYVAALSYASAAGVGGVCLEGVPWEEWLSEASKTKQANSSNDEAESGTEPYTEAMIEVGQVVATSFAGHYFHSKKDSRSRGGSGGGALAKVLMKEYKKLRKMLPSPDPSGGTMVVLFDEDDIQFARAIVTGRSDTPYFGGVFVFDVYFPDQYPHIPPMFQNLTTGSGTWRAHNNLYGDGKVCLSLLQNFSGEASEKWDPEQSSLYQVLMGIQSHILCEEPYYAAGHAKTPAAYHLSRAENREIRFKTIQHAMVSMIREQSRFGEEAAGVIRGHFGSLEGRLVIDMRRCLTEAEAENSPRLAVMRRSVVLAHKWFTKLRAGHSIDDELSLEVDGEGEVTSVTPAGFPVIHETSQQSIRTTAEAAEQIAAEATFLKKDQNDTECKRTSKLDEVFLGREKQKASSATSSVVSATAGTESQSQDGGSRNIDSAAPTGQQLRKRAQLSAKEQETEMSEAAARDARAESEVSASADAEGQSQDGGSSRNIDSGSRRGGSRSGDTGQQLRKRAQLSAKKQETETTEHTLALEAAARDVRAERASRYKRMSQVSNDNKKSQQSKKVCLAVVGMAAAAASAAFVAFNK